MHLPHARISYLMHNRDKSKNIFSCTQGLSKTILKNITLLLLSIMAETALFSSSGLKTLLSTALFCVFFDSL